MASFMFSGDVPINETNRPGSRPAVMVMLDLPVPPGFTAVAEDFAMPGDNRIARYQIQAGHVLVYLRELRPNEPLMLTYRLRATLPVRAQVKGGRAYEYYDPRKQATSPTKPSTRSSPAHSACTPSSGPSWRARRSPPTSKRSAKQKKIAPRSTACSTTNDAGPYSIRSRHSASRGPNT